MFLRKLFLVVSVLLLVSLNSHALTAEDCKNRALNAYDNMAAVGGSDTDKQKLGAYAANECYKEAAAQGNTSSSSLSSSGGSIGAIVLVLAAVGFVAYKVFAKKDQPLTASQITCVREEVREIFKVEVSDSEKMREYKEKQLIEAEDMFATALRGELPITQNTTNGLTAEARKDIQNFRELFTQEKAAAEKALAAAIRVRDSVSGIFSTPMEDENDSEERELRESMKSHLAKAEMDIEKYKDAIAAL